MKFDWDENKNAANHRKHGVWFEEAQTIWVDETSLEFLDPKHDEEDRFIRMGIPHGLAYCWLYFANDLI